MQWYAHHVSNNPSVVILVVLVMTTACIIISLTINDLPSFKDPLLGFEPRGTELAQRSTAWRNLKESTSWGGPLTLYPESVTANGANTSHGASAQQKNGRWADEMSEEDNSSSYDLVIPFLEMDEDHEFLKENEVSDEDVFGRIVYETKTNQNTTPNRILSLENKQFFCNNPGRDYAHVIIGSVSGETLFTTEGLRSICRMDEQKLRNSSHFPELCEQTRQQSCCRSWSIPNYVAVLRNKTTCRDINDTDVQAVLQLLVDCASFYHGMKLSHDCSTEPALCHDVPKQCIQFDAVYNILHYLADTDFIDLKNSRNRYPKLTYTAVFLPTAQSSEALQYYKDLQQMELWDEISTVVGMKLGLKYKLFDDCLVHDTLYIGLAGALIFAFLWIYSSSFFVTFMTFMAVTFSLATAYFMYTVICQMTFFPFMNLLTIVIIIGIGADDACIYCKIWACAKVEMTNETSMKLVRDTLHHACLSMFVTSVTTAAAFFGSVISKITAVRCFSIFAGTAVLANFIFTVSWLPAAVILSEKWCSATCCLCIPPLGVYLPQCQRIWGCSSFFNSVWKLKFSLTDISRIFFDKVLPCLIIKPRYFWILLFTALAAGGAFVVCHYPQLRLPDSKEFQIFNADHPFEKYDLTLKNYFWFAKAKNQEVYRKLPIRVVWGILPIDNGNYFDPYDRGSLVFDETFDVSSQDSQKWLLDFCVALRRQSFYQSTHGPMLSNCFIETFKTWMERKCVDTILNVDRTPCCEVSKFPYVKSVFDICIKKAITILHNTPGYYLVPSVEGPRFSKSHGNITVVVIEYDSIYTYSNSYSEISKFKSSVESWVTEMMETAPKGLKNGWFTSDLEFFDLQDSLSKGTLIAIGVALTVSFIALLVTTLNLLISIYAILTISCVIMVTIGSLVLLGWKLNVLESTTVSIAIGLAVDLTLHYGVAYRLSDQEDRKSSVRFVLSRVGSPVAMAAFTTFMAGALMFPSEVLAYLQTAKFLVILITVSWFYSTFFFLPLLSVMGPENGQLQLDYPNFRCCESSTISVEKTPYALSESTLSSSSAAYPNQIPTSESHELEPLANLKGKFADVVKFTRTNHEPCMIRPRSDSFSSCLTRTKDSTFPLQANRTPRKVSLPTVSFQSDLNPRLMTSSESSSTVFCGEVEKEICAQSAFLSSSDTWLKNDIIM